MAKKHRWLGYFVLGVIAIGLALFFIRVTLNVIMVQPMISQWLPFAIGAVFCAVVALLYLFIAYCFAYRLVDQVSGTFKAAVILLNGNVISSNARIGYVKKVGFGSEVDGQESASVVFFFANRRPWLCTAENFNAN